MSKPKPSVGDIFDAALQLPPGHRNAHVQAACDGDDALRQRVLALLAAHEAAGSFMEDPAPPPRPGAPVDPTPDETRPSGTLQSAAEPAGEAVGQTIGRYKLRQKIGEGGCGVVYVAEQTEPVRRKVAIKVIKLGMDTQQVIARFEAERQALAMMDHPNIAKVLDGGTTETGRPYFAMELVRGTRITDYCDQNKLGTQERLALFTLVCQAIQHAHQKGIIHRDIKPSNILVTLHDGVPVPKVIDFGIAKAIEGRLTDSTVFTQLHQFMGTPAYMSPEQAEMSGLDIDTRSDIYSLGVLLYELLSGTTPFDAKELVAAGVDAMRTIIREQEPVRPSARLGTMVGTTSTTIAQHRSTDAVKLAHQIRGDLDWIVMKCLEKDRTRRYETANGLAADLKRHQENEPVMARPPSTVYRMGKAIRRNRLAFAAGAMVAASLVAGIGVSTWQAIQAKRSGVAEKEQRVVAQAERLAAQAERVTAQVERDNAKAAQKRADATLTRMELQKSEALFAAEDSSMALAYLVKASRRDRSDKVAATRLFSALTERRFHVRLSEAPGSDSEVRNARFSRDGRLLVMTSFDNTVRIFDAGTGQAVMEPIRDEGIVAHAEVSSDGQRVLTVSGNKVRFWDARTGGALQGTLHHEFPVATALFSPDGQRVLTLSTNIARVWDARTGQPLTDPILHADTRHLWIGRFSPDGQRVVTAGNNLVRIWDARSGAALTEPIKPGVSVLSAEFSPDGEQVVTASDPGMARVWEARTGQSVGEPMKHGARVVSARFSPDGTRVLTASFDKTARVWDARTGHPLTEALQHDHELQSAQFSPDGQWVLTDSMVARVWDARTGKPSTDPIRSGHSSPIRPQLSPDGQRIVAVFQDNTAVVWEAHPSQALTEPLRHQSSLRTAEFSQDGAWVVTACGFGGAGDARVWDVRTGLPLTPLLGDSLGSSARFSPDGLRVVTAGGRWASVPDPARESGQARVWDARTGQPLTGPLEHKRRVESAEFSPDGLRVLTASMDATARIWDVRTSQPLTEPLQHGGRITSAQFSRDGLRVVTVGVGPDGKGSAQVWDAGTGQPRTPPFHDGTFVWSAQFSPDGLRVVTGGRGSDGKGSARIWDALTGRPLTEPLRHGAGVGSASYSPDGLRVVTASADKSARVWDALTGLSLTAPLQHGNDLQFAEFNLDGSLVLTLSHNGGARIWDAKTGQPLTEPIQPGDPLGGNQLASCRFSPDGQQVVTACMDGTARIRDFPTVPLPVPEWVLQLAEAIADQRFEEDGSAHRVPFAELSALKSRIASSSEADVWTRWAKWFFADRANRTIAPFSTITRPEYLRRRIEEATPASLQEAVRLAPENGLALARLGQAVLDDLPQGNPRKFGEAAWYSRRAEQFAPEEPEVWELKGDVLEHDGRHAEALAAYHRREKLLTSPNAATPRAPDRAWSKHADICRQLGLRDEAAACIRRMGIPPRDPKAGAGHVDLSAFYTATLRATWNQHNQSDIDLSGLPTGMPVLADTPFDVRGLIQICDDRYQVGRFPERVTGIPVARKGGRLRFLLGVVWGHDPENNRDLPEGTSVASFVVHHANGTTSERPLVLGQDALQWQRVPPPPGEGKPVVAWSGSEPGRPSRTLRLYLVTWHNPRPEEVIASLDFISAEQNAAPFVVAVTVE